MLNYNVAKFQSRQPLFDGDTPTRLERHVSVHATVLITVRSTVWREANKKGTA